jgi:rSAM/selenodomain-associated transferase 1
MSKRPALVVFARAPIPGRTKTRLMRTIGPQQAADLYRCFALDTLAGADRMDADVIVAAAEEGDSGGVRDLVSEACPGAELIVQSGGDLGERMANAVSEALQRGHPRAVVVGTDAPSLPFRCVSRALDLSATHDLVFGPCLDGGYYLIGLRSAIPEIFDNIAWSSDRVLVESVSRARDQGHSVTLLDPWYDIDTEADLRFLQAHLTALSLADGDTPCPRTWEYIQGMPGEWGEEQ